MSTFRTALRIVAAHRVYILVYLVLMSMLGLVTGLSVGQKASTELADVSTTVAVIDRDSSPISQGVSDYLSSVGTVEPVEDSRQTLQDATADGRIQYIVIIPQGFGQEFVQAADSGAEPPLLETIISYDSAASSLMNVRTTAYLGQVRDYLIATTDDPSQAVAMADDTMSRTATVGFTASAGEAESSLPGAFVVFARFSAYPLLAFTVVSIAIVMLAVGRRPVAVRLAAAPATARARSLGLLGACVSIGLVGWLGIVTLGALVFTRDRFSELAPLIGVVALALGAYALVAVSIGFLIGQLGFGENATNAFANIGGMALSFLSGAWVPTELMPSALVSVARFTPGYWVGEAITGAATAPSTSWEHLAPLVADAGMCVLFAVAIGAVAMMVGRSRARASL